VYVLSKRLKYSTLIVGSRVKSGTEFQTIGRDGNKKARRLCVELTDVVI